MRRRIKFYRSHPESYKLIPEISKKVDFRAQKLEFPIMVPLKMRYLYCPEKELEERPKGINDILNFKLMTGNEILLYVEQLKNLRLGEQLGALSELKERDEKNKLDLKNHPWVRATINNLIKELPHLNKSQICTFNNLLYRFGIEEKDTWEIMEKFIKRNIPYMTTPDFGMNYLIAFRDKGWRSSEEFRKELCSVLPVHMKKMDANVVAETFKLNDQFGLVSDYLFEDFYHHVLWKTPGRFVSAGALPLMLEMVRKRNFDEQEEFLWPAVYGKVNELIEEIDRQAVPSLIECLEAQIAKYPSHERFGVGTMVRRLEERRVWEETLGGQAESISLVEMVKNDLRFWRERQKLNAG